MLMSYAAANDVAVQLCESNDDDEVDVGCSTGLDRVDFFEPQPKPPLFNWSKCSNRPKSPRMAAKWSSVSPLLLRKNFLDAVVDEDAGDDDDDDDGCVCWWLWLWIDDSSQLCEWWYDDDDECASWFERFDDSESDNLLFDDIVVAACCCWLWWWWWYNLGLFDRDFDSINGVWLNVIELLSTDSSKECL